MVPATPVHRSLRGASFTKATLSLGMQHSLPQCCRVSIWVKLTDAGCLA
jgi:hypothetical protein